MALVALKYRSLVLKLKQRDFCSESLLALPFVDVILITAAVHISD